MSKILGAVCIAAAALAGLNFLGIYDAGMLIGFDITMAGALVLIATQAFYYVQLRFGGNKTISALLIKVVIALPGILYVLKGLVPFDISTYLQAIIAVVLFMEGIYTMH